MLRLLRWWLGSISGGAWCSVVGEGFGGDFAGAFEGRAMRWLSAFSLISILGVGGLQWH